MQSIFAHKICIICHEHLVTIQIFTSLNQNIQSNMRQTLFITYCLLFRMLNVIIQCMRTIINHLQLIIQWTLNKHFTWHLLILCSCMSFCCLTRMHEVFFLQGSSLPLSKSTSGHKQFINSGFPELSCNLVPGKILSCYHANNLK